VLWLSAVLIAAVSNLDNLAAGAALGLRGTRITLAPNVLIAGVTMAGTAGALTSGHALARLLPPTVADSLAAVIIVSIGVMTVVASRSPVRERQPALLGVPYRHRRLHGEKPFCSRSPCRSATSGPESARGSLGSRR
jgi:hypothetical protein